MISLALLTPYVPGSLSCFGFVASLDLYSTYSYVKMSVNPVLYQARQGGSTLFYESLAKMKEAPYFQYIAGPIDVLISLPTL